MEAAKDRAFAPPPKAWIVDLVAKLQALLAQRTEASALALRRLTGPVTLTPEKPDVGRAYFRVRCSVDSLNLLVAEEGSNSLQLRRGRDSCGARSPSGCCAPRDLTGGCVRDCSMLRVFSDLGQTVRTLRAAAFCESGSTVGSRRFSSLQKTTPGGFPSRALSYVFAEREGFLWCSQPFGLLRSSGPYWRMRWRLQLAASVQRPGTVRTLRAAAFCETGSTLGPRRFSSLQKTTPGGFPSRALSYVFAEREGFEPSVGFCPTPA